MESAIFPIKIIVRPALPALNPITIEEARFILPGKISWENLMHKGSVDTRKNPPRTNKIIDTNTFVLKIKKISGIEIINPN